mmetsp:Transcript_82621/g.230403  ORF Transcript_82621/g.230403 Transcript_82621/m.230403 type:complete len:411 (-) Transcript_82621:89-1321(-)
MAWAPGPWDQGFGLPRPGLSQDFMPMSPQATTHLLGQYPDASNAGGPLGLPPLPAQLTSLFAPPVPTMPASVPVASLPSLPAQDDSARIVEELRGELQKAEGATKAAAQEGGAFVGVVSRLSVMKGTGAIECPEASKEYNGNEVEIPRDQLIGLQVGDTVVFRAVAGDSGAPQASFARKVAELSQQRQRILEVEAPLPAPGAVESAQEYVGFVTSFQPTRGFGFLSCSQTRQLYGSDVYIHRDQYTELKVGDAVHFRVALNPKGVPVARGVRKAAVPQNNAPAPPPPGPPPGGSAVPVPPGPPPGPPQPASTPGRPQAPSGGAGAAAFDSRAVDVGTDARGLAAAPKGGKTRGRSMSASMSMSGSPRREKGDGDANRSKKKSRDRRRSPSSSSRSKSYRRKSRSRSQRRG